MCLSNPSKGFGVLAGPLAFAGFKDNPNMLNLRLSAVCATCKPRKLVRDKTGTQQSDVHSKKILSKLWLSNMQTLKTSAKAIA